jgi:hypothetical protein
LKPTQRARRPFRIGKASTKSVEGSAFTGISDEARTMAGAAMKLTSPVINPLREICIPSV